VRIPADTDVALRLNIVGIAAPDGTPALISVLGNPHFKDEGMIAYEAGYRTQIGARLSMDVAAYYNHYDHQGSAEPATPFFETTPAPPHLVLPSLGQNLIAGETHGAEIEANWKVSKRLTLIPSYDFERIHMHNQIGSQDTTTAPDTNGSDPYQHVRLRSQVDLTQHVTWDASAYFTDRLPAQGVASYLRLDTNVSWRWTDQVTLGMAGQNLLKAQHLEFIDYSGATNSTLIRRSWYVKVNWQF
jgi:iron complex outermembrane receptor protein